MSSRRGRSRCGAGAGSRSATWAGAGRPGGSACASARGRCAPRRATGSPTLATEIGPIDYPDSYRSGPRFIDSTRTFFRDKAAPGDPAKIEWYCFACSFRPWADSADAQAIAVELVGADGSRRRVAARRRSGRWVASEPVPRGGYAYVPIGCARDLPET